MGFPIVVVLDHSGHFYATLQRRLKKEPFDLFMYYQNLKYVDEIAQLQPDLIAVGRQHGFPQNHQEIIQALRSHSTLKNVPILLSLVIPLKEPDAEQLGVRVIEIDPSLENMDRLVSAMHEILDPKFQQN